MRKNNRASTVIKLFGQWGVTSYGLEAMQNYYPISKDRLSEPNWINHMSAKNWVKLDDFKEALEYARAHFGIKKEEKQ